MTYQSISGAAPSGIASAVYAYVRNEIVSGAYAPRDHLTEASIADATGASRTPVREALGRLRAEGYVEVSANRGARVAELGLESANETLELRQILESFGARRAARMATSEHVAELSKLAASMHAAAEYKAKTWSRDLTALNRAFHELIMDASGYMQLKTMIAGLTGASLARITFSTYTADELQRSLRHHDELVSAIDKGDEDWASSVMASHLSAAAWVTERIIGPPSVADATPRLKPKSAAQTLTNPTKQRKGIS